MNPENNVSNPSRLIVMGVDITDISVEDLDQDIIDEMTDEQIERYKVGKTEEEKKRFDYRNGEVESVMLSEEDLKKRANARNVNFSFGGLKGNNDEKKEESNNQTTSSTEIKTEQTGAVIFGVKKQ